MKKILIFTDFLGDLVAKELWKMLYFRGVVSVGAVGARAPTDFWVLLRKPTELQTKIGGLLLWAPTEWNY